MYQYYLLSDEEKKNISSYFVNNHWDINCREALSKKCKVCPESCTGHYGLLDLGVEIVHPFFPVKKLEPPKNLMRYLLIPPPGIRSKSDIEWPDRISSMYEDLIGLVRNKDKNLSTQRGSLESVKESDINKITRKIEEIFGASGSTGIIELLSGKKGVFRKLCFGKRTESSARSVITGDPSLDVDQVYIPKVLANNLFIKCVAKRDGGSYYVKKDLPLDEWHLIPGMECIRKIRDDDLVLINRQPTLSKGSILAFRTKIRADDILTIGIHPNVTRTFNADFDGDEMNIFCFPDSEGLRKCKIDERYVAKIQDSISMEYLGLDSFEKLDRYGLTVSLRDIENDKGLQVMIDSGAKGNPKNMDQIARSVGDQYLYGEFIGTCESSYVKGLNPKEFFIHQKAAREGVVTTGVSTADTGYINRKGCKIMGDVFLDESTGCIYDNAGIIGIF